MKFKSIFFDFDGVIITNSQWMAFEILQSLLLEHGLSIELNALFANYLGLRGEEILIALEKQFNTTIPTHLVTETRTKLHEKLVSTLKSDKHIAVLLNHLNKPYICSSNRLFFINRLLIAANLKQYFPDERIMTCEATMKPKPYPDVYLKALDQCGDAADLCCAVEDSPPGVKAAKAAGLFTFGYLAEHKGIDSKAQAERLIASGANKIIRQLTEILD